MGWRRKACCLSFSTFLASFLCSSVSVIAVFLKSGVPPSCFSELKTPVYVVTRPVMMRRCVVLLCSTLQKVPEGIKVAKDYQQIDLQRKQLAEQERKQKEYEAYPLRYQILDCPPGLPLALTKMKYLLACRRTHPEAGGDPEAFLRVSLAYQDIMKDYGVETVDNQIVNLGNFQTDPHEAQNYLSARAQIQSYIPMSTLEDHIHQLEEVKARLGDDLSQKLASNTDETMWLLEDIEEIMERSGLKTVRVQMLEDGQVKVADNLSLTDGTERPLFLEDYNKAPDSASGAEAGPSIAAEGAAVNASGSKDSGDEEPPQGAVNDESLAKAVLDVEVSDKDIEVLNAKHTVHDRPDVAGLAARTATEVMRNTEEVKQVKMEGAVLFVMLSSIFIFAYLYIQNKARMKQQERSNPGMSEHLHRDTMLPWWGNDAEYESQVKRIFVEEWRKARATSRRTQTFQEGVTRESLDDKTKKAMDLQIFTVTAERLRKMRETAEKQGGRQ